MGRLLLRHQLPPLRKACPATDGRSIWLPATFGQAEPEAVATERFRTMALQQAMRAERGSAEQLPADAPVLQRELYLLLEARAADDALARLLPCLLYTSDAADERSSVDLGGRRIIKKKTLREVQRARTKQQHKKRR